MTLNVEVTINEDDESGCRWRAPSQLEIAEGRSADYYVTLTSRPTATVTVDGDRCQQRGDGRHARQWPE